KASTSASEVGRAAPLTFEDCPCCTAPSLPTRWSHGEDSADVGQTVKRSALKREAGSPSEPPAANLRNNPQLPSISALLRRGGDHLLDMAPIDQIVEPRLEIF